VSQPNRPREAAPRTLGPGTPGLQSPSSHRLLVLLLRFGGVVTSAGFLAILLPVEWMAATHQWLGLGEFPRAPIVDYLARSSAALYGFHGVLLLIVAGNPARHRPIVRYLGVVNVLFGLLMTIIDIQAGMPVWWTLAEGPPTAGFGALVLYLSRSLGEP
jgi:hypothetical protein